MKQRRKTLKHLKESCGNEIDLKESRGYEIGEDTFTVELPMKTNILDPDSWSCKQAARSLGGAGGACVIRHPAAAPPSSLRTLVNVEKHRDTAAF
jgi:hypothetical protein